MTYHYRRGAIVTLVREDGQPGPGESATYKFVDGWKVEIQDEGCVEITQYGAPNPAPSVVLPWHRIWEITTIPD
jgi:hypothetical protein